MPPFIPVIKLDGVSCTHEDHEVQIRIASPIPLETILAFNGLQDERYLTRPSIFAYTVDASECRRRAEDVLSACTAGIIKPSVWKTFPLADVAAAHTAMESGKSSGAIVLTT